MRIDVRVDVILDLIIDVKIYMIIDVMRNRGCF